MPNLYTSKNILFSSEGADMVKCPKCGHEWELNFKCLRCGHTWVPRLPNKQPEVCPKCKSPYWNRHRLNEGGEKKE